MAAELINADIKATLDLLDNWGAAWNPLVDALKNNAEHPLLLVGEGSSRLFPAALFQTLKRAWGLRIQVDHCGAREAMDLDLSDYYIVGLSNSGETREVVELFDKVQAQGHQRCLAVLGRDDGYMAKNSAAHIAVLSQPESAVAATVSVIGQCLVLAQALAAFAGKECPIADIRSAMTAVLEAPLDNAVHEQLQGTHRIFWAGPDNGCAEELSLKTVETCRVAGIYAPGTLVLHGIEEVFNEGDLVVSVGMGDADLAPYQHYIVAGTPARSVRIDVTNGGLAALTHVDLGLWNPLVQLVAGWRVLLAQADILGVDPDKPQRARKVGNPRVSADS